MLESSTKPLITVVTLFGISKNAYNLYFCSFFVANLLLFQYFQMDAHNLAIVFGPTLVRPQEDSMVAMVRDNNDQCQVIESIILHVRLFTSHNLFICMCCCYHPS